MFGDSDPQVVQIMNRQRLERVLTSLELKKIMVEFLV